MFERDEQYFNDDNIVGALDTSVRSRLTASHVSPSIPSIATHRKERDQARSQAITKRVGQDLAKAIVERIEARFGSIWLPVDASVATKQVNETSSFTSRLILLFHISAFLDIGFPTMLEE